MRVSVYIGVFILLSTKLFSQGEIDDENKALLRNEKTFYVLLNSNGAGFGYSFGKMKSYKLKNQWHFEGVRIKDPKEIKVSTNPNYRRFVYGKANDFYALRGGYGYLHKLYLKKDIGGIEIRYFYNAGLSIALLKPMYYYVRGVDTITVERVDESLHNEIKGGGPYFKGFGEMSVIPGAYLKVGTSFEFSKRDLAINAIEAGLCLDVYPKEIKIMANNQDQFYYLSLFLSYRFGKVINPRAIIKNPKEEKKLN